MTVFRRYAFLPLLALLVVLSACRAGNETGNTSTQNNRAPQLSRERTTGARGGVLRYRVTTPPKSLNSLMITDEASFIASFILTGGRLIDFDHDKQAYVGGLAEQWQASDDHRTVEMTLRDNLKFSDGHPLTTEDVVFTLRAIYDERTASVFRTTMTIGGRQIEATPLDARRIRFTFPETVGAPESFLVNVAVMPRHILEADLQKGTLGKAYELTADPAGIVTAGAFAVEAIAPGERLTFRRNPHYWKKDAAGTQLPYLDQVVLEVVADPNAAIQRLQEGALDIIDRTRPSDYAALQNSQGSVRAYDLGPGLSTDHMWFNLDTGQQQGKPAVDPVKSAWFTDLRFRRAVSHAIDRQGISANTLQGLATPLYGIVSPGNRAWHAQDLPRTEYDLERARSLLTEAGFNTRGAADAPELFDSKGNRVEFTLLVPVENQARKEMAAVVQEDLARLGIRMQVAPVEYGELVSRTTQTSNYEAVLLGAVVTDVDPSSYSNILSSSSPQHQWHPKQQKPATEWEARIDQMLTALSQATNVDSRRNIFRDIQLTIYENQPVVPIVVRHVVSAANTRIGNYRPSIVIPYSLWNVEELFIRP